MLRRALSELRSGRAAEAEPRLRQAVAILGEVPAALNGLGNALRRQGKHRQALSYHERAVAAAPDSDKAHSDLGLSALACGDVERSIRAFTTAAAISPYVAELQYNLGSALLHGRRLAEARDALARAVALDGRHARAIHNLALSEKQLGHPQRALALQRKAFALTPQDPEIEWNLGLTELLLGDYSAGFAHFEARTRLHGYPYRGPFWDGRAIQRPLTVLAEQGLGDTLMYARFLEPLSTKAPHVRLVCQPPLIPLLQAGLRFPVEVGGHDSEGSGAHIPLLSLPALLGPAVAPAPAASYLGADPERVAAFRRRFEPGPPAVGLAYQGNPRYRQDEDRSIALSQLLPLLRLPGYRFVSFQKGFGAEQLARLPRELSVEDLGSALDNGTGAFVETAAALCAIEVLVTSDSAIAHLAGALGVAVWLLLPAMPDFRWGLSGSRWYRSMTVLRQPAPGDWAAVIREVAARLRAGLHPRHP